MNPLRLTAMVAISLAAALAVGPFARAQQQPAPAKAPTAQPARAAPAAGKTFSQQDLDELLAPIALYPDALLAQVLMASTYPLEVVEAARWQKANASLKDKALEEALKDKTWDASVKSLTMVPQVLPMMNEKLDWTQKLGDAVLAQQEDVMKTAQGLRKKAKEAGNLKSSPEVNVKEEKQNEKTVVIIESAKPDTVYVPTYNPATAYGPWWYSYPPPYYYYPPGYVAGGAFWGFTAGVIVGGAIWGGCGWGNNEINIDVDRQNNFNRNTSRNTDRAGNTNRGGNNKFQHNAEHRKGVNYRDNATAQKYNRGTDRAAAQSREQFRGHANQSRQQLQGMDRGQLQSQVSAADRQSRGSGDRGGGDRGGASASQRGGGDFGSRGGGASASQRSGGGFSGASGSGASARQASSRGSSSMGSRGGGGGRGGGGRR